MSICSAATWVKFFAAAGIPSPVSASYAHAFVENRMQMDMLMDLNKEYLREMGICPMGDIIAILRHAKQVHDQAARDKVLSTEIKVPVATISASPSVVTVAKTKPPISNKVPFNDTVKIRETKVTTENSLTQVKPRRVLPEHEGRYKITLPLGTTPRSKDILLKAQMLSDQKGNIFDRLNNVRELDNEMGPPPLKQNPSIRITGLDKPASSVFARLGDKNKTDGPIIESSPSYSGILKNSPNKKPHLGIVKKTTAQKVILVKKIPAKAATMVADEIERMELSEPQKFVSFSSEDEIVEIAPRRLIVKPRNKVFGGASNNIKSRLGFKGNQNQQNVSTASISLLHKTKKTIKLKSPIMRNIKVPAASMIKLTKMKSDQMLTGLKEQPIHTRLDLKKRPISKSTANHLAQRMGEVSLDSRIKKKNDQQGNSVFQRLGYNK